MNFDGHSDIWTDVVTKSQKGERDIFRKYHYDRLQKGEIEGGIFVIWNDPPNDKEPLKRTHETMEAITTEQRDAKDILVVPHSYDEMLAAQKEGKFYAFIGLEGLKSVGEDIDLINEFYGFGARHASLTWNEENPLATGTLGNSDRGLSKKGKQAVKRIEDLGMILDVSHLNDKSFWDLLGTANNIVVATHSNCRALCNNKRNLTDEMIKEIGKTGGLVGLNSFNEFVSEDQNEQTLERLVDHLVHMVDLIGVEKVGFGFDFSEFLEGDTLSSFSSQENPYTKGLEDASKVPALVEEIKKRGFSDEEIELITCKNWHRVIKSLLK